MRACVEKERKKKWRDPQDQSNQRTDYLKLHRILETVYSKE